MIEWMDEIILSKIFLLPYHMLGISKKQLREKNEQASWPLGATVLICLLISHQLINFHANKIS